MQLMLHILNKNEHSVTKIHNITAHKTNTHPLICIINIDKNNPALST